jgi:hypothetical protein
MPAERSGRRRNLEIPGAGQHGRCGQPVFANFASLRDICLYWPGCQHKALANTQSSERPHLRDLRESWGHLHLFGSGHAGLGGGHASKGFTVRRQRRCKASTIPQGIATREASRNPQSIRNTEAMICLISAPLAIRGVSDRRGSRNEPACGDLPESDRNGKREQRLRLTARSIVKRWPRSVHPTQ